MTRLLLALALSGCAANAGQFPPPAHYASDPAERYGWSSRPICYHICRAPSTIVKVTVRRAF